MGPPRDLEMRREANHFADPPVISAMRLITIASIGAALVWASVGAAQTSQVPVTERDVAAAGPTLSPAERIFGLSTIWARAASDFPFPDRLAKLNWDSVYAAYIPKVLAAPHTVAYYDSLMRFSALLQDGHTNVYYPPEIQQRRLYFTSPRVDLVDVDGRVIVTNVAAELADSVPIGAEIVAVEGTATASFLAANVYPFLGLPPGPARRSTALDQSTLQYAKGLLAGRALTTVSVDVMTSSGTHRVVLTRDLYLKPGNWIRHARPRPSVTSRDLGDGLVYIGLNSFQDEKALSAFDSLSPAFVNAKGLVLDLRDNGGGDDHIGFAILSQYFFTREHSSASWRTRVRASSYMAWGANSAKQFADSHGLTFDSASATFWYAKLDERVDAVKSHVKIRGPVIVLVGRGTASAAEDFLIPIDGDPQFTTLGDSTFGSTGQPLPFALPGGGRGRIVSKADYYPDGRMFVGHGVVPQIIVRPSLQDAIDDRDSVLDRAVQVLRERLRRR
jgi:carboxyl-terminal processing protease